MRMKWKIAQRGPLVIVIFFYAKREKPLDVTITIFCQNPGRDRDGITYRYLFVMKKVFNWSELHLSEVTSYKIHTLG